MKGQAFHTMLVGGLVAINFRFSQILGMSSSQLTFIYSSEGWPSHQPAELMWILSTQHGDMTKGKHQMGVILGCQKSPSDQLQGSSNESLWSDDRPSSHTVPEMIPSAKIKSIGA